MHYTYIRHKHFCSFNVTFLALFWTVGLICGVCYAANNLSVVVLMRLAILKQVSIVGLLYVLVLPLLIAVICVYYSRPAVFYLLIALKAFFSSTCLYWVANAYGSAAWLVQILLLFSATVSNAILLWVGYKQAHHVFSFHIHCVFIVMIILFIGLIDYLLLSPFTVTLLN